MLHFGPGSVPRWGRAIEWPRTEHPEKPNSISSRERSAGARGTLGPKTTSLPQSRWPEGDAGRQIAFRQRPFVYGRGTRGPRRLGTARKSGGGGDKSACTNRQKRPHLCRCARARACALLSRTCCCRVDGADDSVKTNDRLGDKSFRDSLLAAPSSPLPQLGSDGDFIPLANVRYAWSAHCFRDQGKHFRPPCPLPVLAGPLLQGPLFLFLFSSLPSIRGRGNLEPPLPHWQQCALPSGLFARARPVVSRMQATDSSWASFLPAISFFSASAENSTLQH